MSDVPDDHKEEDEFSGVFDNAPRVIGEKVGRMTVQPMENLARFIPKKNIRIGIITTPANHAQAVTDQLIEWGIKAIWNFAPVRLDVPQDIFVQDENLAESFSFISHFMKQFEKKTAQKKVIKKAQKES